MRKHPTSAPPHERTSRDSASAAHRPPEAAQPAPAVHEADRLLEELQIQRELLDSMRREVEVEREQLRELFHLAPEAYLLTDPEGVIQGANHAAAALLHEPEGSLAGVALDTFLPEPRGSALRSRLRMLAHREQKAEWEMRLTPHHGEAVDVGVTVAAVRDGGRTVGFRWLLRDVTHQRRAELATRRLAEEQAARLHAQSVDRRNAFLAEAGEILAGSLDYATTLASVARLAVPRLADSCIVYVLEEDGRVERVGVAHRDPAREAALRHVLEQRPFDAGSLTGPVARAIRSGETELIPEVGPADAEAFARDPEGEWAVAEVSPRALIVVPLRVRDRVLGALSLGWDEAGRHTADDLWLARKLADRAALAVENARLHREVRRASEAKSDFLAAMSHEFRTPLTAIVAFAELLVDGIPEPIAPAPRGHAERIAGAARHLTQLIDQVLTLSRIEAGREKVRPERVELGTLARETAELIEPLARQKGVDLAVEVPGPGPVARTDPNKLRQVLFNLLGNAVKFTEAGEVRLTLHERDGRAVFEIRDTGEGISPEHLARMWEPFWQADLSAASRPPGTGLGLGIVRRLVRLLGGEIRAESEPGVGSVFHVELPVDTGGA